MNEAIRKQIIFALEDDNEVMTAALNGDLDQENKQRNRELIKQHEALIAKVEKGKTGKVLTVIPEKQRVIVEKVNFIKRHTRPSARQRQGGIIEKEGSIHISNLMVVCSKCNKRTRIGGRILEDRKKARVCNKCGEILPG